MKKKWSRVRHRVITVVVRFFLRPIMRIKYGFKGKKFKGGKRGYLVLSNHQTSMDQFFIACILGRKTYYIGSDDLLTIRFLSPLLQWAVRLIPYKKASTDFTILRTCRQVASENCNIVMFPEGNRTYTGKTCYINPTVAKMIKFLKMPVAFVHIENGYGVLPRFANKERKGKCSAEVFEVLEYDEYKDLSNEQIEQLVKEKLSFDESIPSGPFKSKRKAEYLERVIYNCPICGFSHFISNKDTLTCMKCNASVDYNEYKQFESKDGKIPFKNVDEWYSYQRKYISNLSLSSFEENQCIFEDKGNLFLVIPRKKKQLLLEYCNILLFKDRIEFITEKEHFKLLLEDIVSSGVFGKNKVNFYTKEKTYQIKSDVHFNALKYVEMIYKYKQEIGGASDEIWGI
ncbi:MAG: 1-acyl-sn-glycerol-3-phosphate acyltransferase [Bacilli bacterium]|nr:1-acyl-sn-glycerol-3-phosphate acyltransferase [Bacilli bacterium]